MALKVEGNLINGIWVDNKYVHTAKIDDDVLIETFQSTDIQSVMNTERGSPAWYSPRDLYFTTNSPDILKMKPNYSCRALSGNIAGVNINYDSSTSGVIESRGTMIATALLYPSCRLDIYKLSYGLYQTRFTTYLEAGRNYIESTSQAPNAAFNFYYDGEKYISTFGNMRIESARMREEFSRIEFGGSNYGYNLPQAASGVRNMTATITRGVSQ